MKMLKVWIFNKNPKYFFFKCRVCGKDAKCVYNRKEKSKYCGRKCANSDPAKKDVLKERMKIVMSNFRNENAYNAKLNWEKVGLIRSDANKNISSKDIAKEFGVSESLITQIRGNRAWKK